MTDSSGARTARGAKLVGLGILASRLVGLVRNRLFAVYFGATPEAEAYNAALKIPNVVRNLLGEGAISATFVPVYAAALAREDKEGGRALANALLGVLLAGVSLITILGIALAPVLTWIIGGSSPEVRELTTKLLRVLFPMTGLMVLSGWCLGVQNAHRRFFMSYASAVAWSVTQIVLLLLAGPSSDLTTLVWWLSWATLLGSVLQITVQMPQVMRLMGTIRPAWNLDTPGLRGVLTSFVPVVSALGLFQISGLIDLEITSFLPEGSIATMGYMLNLYLLPLSLFGVATAAAALPELARARELQDTAQVTHATSTAFESVLFYTIPSAIAFVAIGDCMIQVLYGGGKMTPDVQRLVHIALAVQAIGLVSYAITRVLASSYQAARMYKPPFVAAAWAIGINAVTAIALALPFRDHPASIAGVAAGSAVGANVNLFLLWRRFRESVGEVDLSGAKHVASRAFVAAIIAAALGVSTRLALRGSSSMGSAIVAILTFGAAYMLIADRMGLAEANRLFSAVKRRVGL